MQNISFNKNLETTNDFFDRKKVVKFIKFCLNHPLGFSHSRLPKLRFPIPGLPQPSFLHFVFPQYAFVATAFIKIRFHSSTFPKTCFSSSAVVKTFLAGSAFARYILYLPNFTIFNKNKSPVDFQTLQNGGGRGGSSGRNPEKMTKIMSKCHGTKNRQPFISSKLDNFQQN